MGGRPPCRNSGTLSREGCPWGTHRKFQTLSDTKRFIAPHPLPLWDLIIQELPMEEHRKFFIKKKKNSKSFPLLISLGDKYSFSHQRDTCLLPWVGTQKNHKDEKLSTHCPEETQRAVSGLGEGKWDAKNWDLWKRKERKRKDKRQWPWTNRTFMEVNDRQNVYEVPTPHHHPCFFLGSQPEVQWTHIWDSADSSP